MSDHFEAGGRYVANAVATLLQNDARMATKFVSEKTIVRATRRLYRGRIEKNEISIALTIGSPNHAERRFIARCKEAGEPFPVKKIALKFPVKKKRKR